MGGGDLDPGDAEHVERQETLNVLAVSAQAPSAPGFRVRILLLRSELERQGIRIEPLPLFSDTEAARFVRAPVRTRIFMGVRARRRLRGFVKASPASVALVQRQVDLSPSLSLERLAGKGRRLVWDVDDAIWLDTSAEAGGHPLARLKNSRAKARWLARRADHVIVANSNLASYISRYTERLTVIPSLVETRSFDLRHHSNGDAFTVGWIGSPTTAPHLGRLQEVLPRVAQRLRGRRLRLLTVGGPAPAIAGVKTETVAWSIEAERMALARMDVGVMPLQDSAWARGKSAYKAVVYMAAGIPVVADDVGIASETIKDAGRVADDETGWVEALVEFAEDAGLRDRFGRSGRERVERNYSVFRWAPVVGSILRGEPQ